MFNKDTDVTQGCIGGSVANYRKQESLSSQAIDFPKPNFRILPPNPNFATEPLRILKLNLPVC
jgi:hypothetical protein